MAAIYPLPAVAAGHLCLDIIPGLDHLPHGQFEVLFRPGRLIQAGIAQFSTGGPVSNTGLALHRLGVPARLVAKIGADPFGDIVRGIVAQYNPQLVEGIRIAPDVPTSYSVIISPPDTDRIFLHCPGANDTFLATDIDYSLVERSALFHFGYPPLMRSLYTDNGQGLVEVLRRAKETGVTTSLDMSFPDPTSESGQVDWRAIYTAALPYVDIFLPSIEEIMFTLRREMYEQLNANGTLLQQVTPELLVDISEELLGLGVKIVVLKLSENGLYLRSADETQMQQLGRARPEQWEAWANKELRAPCFQVEVTGTTGSGDATIAGFLSALLRGLPPEKAMTMAVAVGACNVEAADALSGLRTWDETVARVDAGWARHLLSIRSPGWQWDDAHSLWVGSRNI
ncbi:MAG: carbohydrate kinase family protein [Anaerolineae bacterium]|nr:carbohydrate kinase family protein [Anaerolineae bacterium]